MPPQTDLALSFGPETLRDPQFSLNREWLVTNGLGGYASASLAGANTRRYHGLLVAALNAPLGRAVLLSKLEETLQLTPSDGDTATFELATNRYPGATHPQGYAYLTQWDAYPAPRWRWSPAPGVQFEKRVFMPYGRNASYSVYTLTAAPDETSVELHLTPLLAWKDYHSEMHAGRPPQAMDWNAEESVLRLLLPGVWGITEGAFPLSLALRQDNGAPIAARFEPRPDWYLRFQHPREQERGQDSEEDLFTPGRFAIPLRVGESITVIATVEEGEWTAPSRAWDAYVQRHDRLRADLGSADAFAQRLALAADAFIVQVPDRRTTIMAGYPWFSDWGRDTMIALPGLCLTTQRNEIARQILLSFAQHTQDGLLPNRFPDLGDHPEYNTVDATLWYFNALYRYVLATDDLALIGDSLWTLLEEIIDWHRKGTRYRIHEDPNDHLLYAGEEGVQLTWMDAKIGDWVVTPRTGKPVEINALWHNALRIMAHFASRLKKPDAATYYTELASHAAAAFLSRFPRSDGQGLYDVLDAPNGAADDAIRPNQIFAVSLPFAPVPPESPVAQSVVQTVQAHLVTEVGLRSLAPSDPAYRPRYEGGSWSRDSAYHQGTVWVWQLGAFAEAHYKVYRDREAALGFLRPLQNALQECGIGSLCEIYDADPPRRPNGCIAQAWSVAETLRAWQWLASL